LRCKSNQLAQAAFVAVTGNVDGGAGQLEDRRRTVAPFIKILGINLCIGLGQYVVWITAEAYSTKDKCKSITRGANAVAFIVDFNTV